MAPIKLTYQEALKQAKAEKPKENYMTIQMDAHLVMPHKDGIAMLIALVNAEKLSRSWSSDPPIMPFQEETCDIKLMSAHEYQRRKIATLMGISWGDFTKAEQEAAAQQATTPP